MINRIFKLVLRRKQNPSWLIELEISQNPSWLIELEISQNPSWLIELEISQNDQQRCFVPRVIFVFDNLAAYRLFSMAMKSCV